MDFLNIFSFYYLVFIFSKKKKIHLRDIRMKNSDFEASPPPQTCARCRPGVEPATGACSPCGPGSGSRESGSGVGPPSSRPLL